MFKSIGASILFAAASAAEAAEWSRNVDNCGAWVGDLSNDARQAWSSFASYLVYSGMYDDNADTLNEYIAKSGKYASSMVKDTGMIAGNCFGSEWAHCAEYGGRTGASAFSLYYDIVKAYKYC